MDFPSDLIPSPQTYFRFYDALDVAENILSAGAAIPIPVIGSFSAYIKTLTGAGLIGLGLAMCATAKGIQSQARISSRPLSAKMKKFTVDLHDNSAHFIKHGVGNLLIGYYFERPFILGTACWLVRVALRSVMAEKENTKNSRPEQKTIKNRFIEIITWPFKDLYKIMDHIKSVNKVQSQRMGLDRTASGPLTHSAEYSRSFETDVDITKMDQNEVTAQQAELRVFEIDKLVREKKELLEQTQKLQQEIATLKGQRGTYI